MPILQDHVLGTPEIGLYCWANEAVAFLPMGVGKKKLVSFSDCLGVPSHTILVSGSRLLGIFIAGNSEGLVLPHTCSREEVALIKKAWKGRVKVLKEKKTALGNLIVANDYGAVADPRFSERTIKDIAKTLGVPVVRGEIGGLPHVGSMAVSTNTGILLSSSAREEEVSFLRENLKVQAEKGTINSGNKYVHSGIIANSQGAVAGNMTNGPELLAVTRAFSLG